MRCVATALATLILTLPAASGAAKQPPCAAGRFAVDAAASPLVPGGAATPDLLTLGGDGTLALASGCPGVAAKQKGSRKGSKLSAKWTKKKGLCAGLPKAATLKAAFDPSCEGLSGSFKSKGVKRTFSARRLPAGLGTPSLAPTLDAARAVTERVGPAGGEVRARGADGTKYVLLFPPGALSAAVDVTMTPVTAVGGLPLAGGLVAAVELEPEGLAFALPAELKLIPPGGLPDLAAGFSGTGPASRFGVEPSWEDPERRFASLALEHFSLYGLAIPGPTQLAAFAADLAVIQGWLDLVFTLAAECSETCDWEAILADWYDLEVDPRLDDGAAPVAAALAGHEALSIWLRLAELAAVGDAPQVASRLAAGRAQNHANLLAQVAAYTEPGCSGAVSDWKDWLRIPDEIGARAKALYQGELLAALEPAGRYCASLELRDISFPEEIGEATTSLPLSFQTVVAAPGGDVGVSAKVDLHYETANATGPAEISSAADGSAAAVVVRETGTPRFVELFVQAQEAELERTELTTSRFVAAGSLGLAFEADFDPAPPAYLEPGSHHELCVRTTVEPFAGQTVYFFLDGPGAISAPDAQTVDDVSFGRACIDYTAPGAPVAKDLEVLLTATLVAGGETYQDTLHLHPAWVDVRVHADVGEGWVPATNQTLDAEGNGPFDLRATFTRSPPLVGDPPPHPSFAGEAVTAETDEATLRFPGSVPLFLSLVPTTDAFGRALVEWDGTGASESVSTITFFAADLDEVSGDDPVSAASSTLDRGGLPDMGVQFPDVVQPGVATPLVVTVFQDGEPAPGYVVEVEAEGGTVAPGSGITDADGQFQGAATLAPEQALLTLTVTLREEPGDPALDVQVVQASVGGGHPSVRLVSRRHACAGVAGGVRVGVYAGPQSCPEADWTLDSDVVTSDGTSTGDVLSASAQGTGVPAHGPLGSWGRVDASVEFRVEAEPVLATFELSASGPDAEAALAPTGSGAELVGCADAGVERCPPGVTAAGAVVLQPGSYRIGGGTFVLAGSFELEVSFSAAPTP